ncbi:chorismate-binding protein [Siphonobacter aquaeclarae]|uniref:Isochorismate synthase n=1 Tax=Siphonobacter aquaeclarae TaxID=563176 RepID=A0A1G9U0W9_9BACT|nr:chorismate-binding protein [Siphonobacter aquaeclarae]SDM53647.1 isochorismate synthase [Siphonobacter aquaeclarae]
METAYSQNSSIKTHSLSNLWRTAERGGYPAALWRLPKSSEKQLIIDLSGEDRRLRIDLEELPAGFAISPFLNPESDQTRFLRADLYFSFNAEEQLISEETASHADFWRIQAFEDDAEEDAEDAVPYSPSAPHHGPATADEREKFEEAVRHAVAEMKMGAFQKVVLSRRKWVELPKRFDHVAAFNRLCDAYPHAFVSLVSLPESGSVWLGATPELLVSQDLQGTFRTMSLAATQSATGTDGHAIPLEEARWSHKEIEEQALVSRYVIECFKKIRLREYLESGPRTVRAGNLLHLRTDFKVDTQAVGFPQLATVMLDLLHPTSAVCGTPKSSALRFLEHYEAYDRSYYSGYLGPVNINQETHLFVNLRTMQIEDDEATLFAGAGITEDSVAENEWMETEMKCQTLLSALSLS